MGILNALVQDFLTEIYEAKVNETPVFYEDKPDLSELRSALQYMHQQALDTTGSTLQGYDLIAAMTPLVEACAELLLQEFGDNGEPTELYMRWMAKMSDFRDAVVADIMGNNS